MKKVLLVVRNSNKISNSNKIKAKPSNKRGSELAQTVLITAIMITLIAALFFPQIKALFESAMSQITTWFNGVLADITG